MSLVADYKRAELEIKNLNANLQTSNQEKQYL